jgi:2-aminoadipate transaminase
MGVVFVIGSAFFVDGSGHDTIRLSFSAPSIERIEEGVRRLSDAVTELEERQAASLVPGDGQVMP